MDRFRLRLSLLLLLLCLCFFWCLCLCLCDDRDEELRPPLLRSMAGLLLMLWLMECIYFRHLWLTCCKTKRTPSLQNTV